MSRWADLSQVSWGLGSLAMGIINDRYPPQYLHGDPHASPPLPYGDPHASPPLPYGDPHASPPLLSASPPLPYASACLHIKDI